MLRQKFFSIIVQILGEHMASGLWLFVEWFFTDENGGKTLNQIRFFHKMMKEIGIR